MQASSGSVVQQMHLLSALVLSPRVPNADLSSEQATLARMSEDELTELAALANSNHVIVRAFDVARALLENHDPVRTSWLERALEAERTRIAKAATSLEVICAAFQSAGLDVTVMKSLDHWPDLGSDLDLFTNASASSVCRLMVQSFGATVATQSWGDRLAGKWNFSIPDLPELVEVHTQRLGQTGEQIALASRIPGRSRRVALDGITFSVPSASDRLLISTLQRMYRHFYFRLCDVVDSAELILSGQVDFEDLRASARTSGIWEGVATYLVIVADYVRRYGVRSLDLPQFVVEAARFDGGVVYVGKSFIRVPILPQSVGLYRTQLVGSLRHGQLRSSARLSLLPWLATAAAVGQKITGSDKGIW